MSRLVRTTVSFLYDADTYIYDWDENIPSDDVILLRCKKMMLEDITDYEDPLTVEGIHAEFLPSNGHDDS